VKSVNKVIGPAVKIVAMALPRRGVTAAAFASRPEVEQNPAETAVMAVGNVPLIRVDVRRVVNFPADPVAKVALKAGGRRRIVGRPTWRQRMIARRRRSAA